MAQRHDIINITFQANARGANAAIESLRVKAEECDNRVTKLRKDLKEGIQMGKSSEELQKIRTDISAAEKETRQWSKAYKELIKGMSVLDQGIKAFNDGSLAQMSAAFQKTLYNAAKLTRTKLAPDSETFKKDFRELTALMDAAQTNFVRLQGDAQTMLDTLRNGGKVSTAALNEELKAQRELLSVLSESDKGYKQTQRNVAELDLYLKKMGGDYEFIKQNMTDTKKVSDDMLRNMYKELEQVNAEGKVTQKIMQENAAAMKEIRTEQARRVESVLGGNLGQQSEQSIRAQIAVAKELLQTYKTNSKEAQTLSSQIVNAEEHLKTHGVEAARAAQREAQQIKTQEEAEKQLQATMKNRLTSLKTLSADALAETRKYWEAQRNGAEAGSAAFKKAEDALRKIDALERNRKVAQLDTVLADPKRFGVAEVRNAVQEMEKLRDSVQQGIPQWQHYNKMVEQGKAYLDQLAKTEAAAKISSQMQNLTTTLSASGLAEVKKYWETMVAGAEHGSTELTKYETELKKVIAEEQRRAELQAQSKVGILSSGNLGSYSEAEIRKAIEAGQQLIQTYKSGSDEAEALAKNIVAAEEHVKQYGVEAQRAAVREQKELAKVAEQRQKNDELMKQQLQQGTSLSQSALKAQEQYWQRLIDDPKTASTSLQEYKNNLQQVKTLQEQMASETVKTQGESALAFFRSDTSNASADQIKQNTEALKKYRDSLPQQTNANIIAEINSYITKTGEAAKVAAGEMMSLSDAEALAGKLGTQGFSASTNQLKMAKKALEEAQNAAGRGTPRFKELQEAINKVDLELTKTGEIAKNVQDTLDQPKGKSINELKQAVDQGRLALNNMDRSTKEGQKQFDTLAKKIKEADFELKRLTGTAKGSATAFDKAWSRLKTYVGLYVGAAVAMQKIVATMGDLMELSDKMGEVRKTTGFTADEVGRLSDNLKKLDVRTSLTSLMELSSLAGSVGLKTQEDVQGFTEAANQLMIALPEMGNESARTLIKIATATGDLKKNNDDVRETLERVGSTIIALRANSASAAPAITDFVSRVGAVGAQAGISIDQIAALGSTIDALGGRVEMSATALSRMIPAIRNNAFGVANAIGVTEKTLTDLFNQGKSMEAMVLIFQKMRESVKQFDTSTEEGMNAMADNVEALLGKNASMAEVMKELNQQGARAGIVFGLLSQNVDELQRQLGLAGEAYSKNMALQEEYNKMNDTTAAKWERLKNTFEEMFVSDSMQRRLGWIIDRLKDLVDFIAEDGPIVKGLKVITTYAIAMKIQLGATFASAGTAFRNLGVMIMSGVNVFATAMGNAINVVTGATHSMRGLRAATIGARRAWLAMDATMKANIWGAIIAAIGMLAYKLWEVHKAAMEAAAEVGRFNQKLGDEKKALDDLFTPLEKGNIAQKERSRLITEINSKYGKYLGYMLSETNSAIALADAHALVAKRMREEAYEKRILEQEDTVQKKYEKDINAGYGRLVETVRKYATSGTDANEVADYLNAVIQSNTSLMAKSPGMYNPAWTPEFGTQWNAAVDRMIQSGKLRNVQGLKSDLTIMTSSYLTAVKKQEEEIESATAATRSDLRNVQKSIKTEVQNNLASLVDDVRNYGKTVVKATTEATTKAIPQTIAKSDETKKVGKNWNWGGTAYEGQTPKTAKKELKEVQEVGEWKPNVNKKDIEQVKKFVETQDQLRGYLQQNAESISEQSRATAEAYLVSEEELEKLRDLLPKGTTNKPTKEPNPYGDFNRVMDSYDKWDADSLVARRKEMLERVRALANGADVQAVLSEDAKFISEATRKNIKTTRDAIEWYNTERLKIQESLHERHLTNTGDWMDPTNRKGREKTIKAEWKAYLDELDAYYTARKTKIQDARNDELITEAEAWRRTLQNDAEWRQRRAELQQLYANKSVKVSAEETQAIYDILAEQTGESSDYIKKDIAQTVKFILAIGAKSKDEMEKLIGQIDKGTEQDFFRQRVAIGKQMDAIADIIEKERPFNGITENLQANLTKMGVLQADFEKKRNALLAKREDTSEVDREMEEAIPQRISFLLEEAEHAYNTTIDEVLKRMADKGMKVWADEIKSDTMMQEALMGQLHSTFDKVQEAIKKEASLWKKEAENMWNNILMPDGKTTLKQLADQVTAQLSLDANRVGRANNLIGAGQASERVVDKLAIQQMKVQLAMQQHYYNLMRERGQAAIKDLERQAALAKEREDYEEATRKELDAQHARMALNLATTKEQTELAKQQEEIIARTEESQNRLYKELKSWAELLASSMQELFEAEHAGDREYYNERAKLALTGKGGPGAGTYVVIENEGTSSAKAHYEYLSEEEALEREHQIEIENARAEAWKKVMDEFNEKLNDAITDQINAMLQNQSIDANTQAVIKNTEALAGMTSALGEKGGSVNIPSLAGAGNLLNVAVPTGEGGDKNETGVESGAKKTPVIEVEPLQNMEWEGSNGFSSTSPYINPNQGGADFWQWDGAAEAAAASAESQVDSINKVQTALDHQFHQQLQGTKDTNDAIKKNTQSMFASMTAAANLYGVAYQAMSNDNLSTSQKFQMIALQAAGNAAISGLTAALAQDTAETTSSMPAILAKCLKINPIWGSVLFGALTATLGGLMGMAASKITKSKAQIAQATGASAASAGKLTTGMLTYAEGNVNEFTDPGTLTEGRHYNVDAADGRTYRAKYMGKNAKTHITNGPEFHLVGEKGREAIIDAKTTRQIQMDDNGIWRSIQTLYNGGRISSVSRRRGRGVMAFADGNIDEFDSVDSGQLTVDSYIDLAGMQASLDRNSAVQEALLERLSKPIQAKFDVYGKGGLVDSYDTGKKTVNRHGERY